LAIEIERKFLLRSEAWRRQSSGSELIVQGYLANTARSSVRVRLAGTRAWLSVKSMTRDIVRQEFEYPIPSAEADAMLYSLCEGPLLQKRRHDVRCGASRYEVDEFHGRNAGLVVAEIELESPDQDFERPDWLGDEVTRQSRYYSFRLTARPFEDWPRQDRDAARAGRHLASAPDGKS